ncbi:secondary thiamine-phosphate synthase enzyme YjbQ [Mesoaciditoga sp.]
MWTTLNVRTHEHFEMVDITQEIEKLVRKSGVKSGRCIVYVPHTTAAVTINENADPSVKRDILHELSKVIPWNDEYTHIEGNSAAHILSTLVGVSELLPIEEGHLLLGTWQGVYFCEFDGPRSRKVLISVVED